VTTFLAVLATASIALTACGGDSGESASPTSSQTAATSDVKVGLAYDIGGRGDQSFNDSAATGLDKAATEFGVEVKELEATSGETDAQKEERLRLLAQGGYNPVIGVGFAYATSLKKVAAEFPDTSFAIVDDASFAADNVANLVFAEHEGSFLVGVVAGQATTSNNVGFIGGVNTPLLQKFEAGYAAGVKAVNPGATVQVRYLTEPPDFTGFTDPAKGKTVAQGMIDAGADVIYAAAGGSGTGAFEAIAAKGEGSWAIGVDSDQYQSAADNLKPFIVTSALKRVDNAVYSFVESAVEGSPLTGVQTFDLKVDGVGYSTSNSAIEPFEAKVEEYKQQIIDGSLTVPDKP
jgi:basic membrane protein A